MIKLLITIPCHNEEVVLEKNIFAVVEYAKNNLSQFSWNILIITSLSELATKYTFFALYMNFIFVASLLLSTNSF